MKWKLWTRNENIMPATTESEQHDSKDAGSCGYIVAWCKARAARVLSKAAREAGWLCLCEIPQVGKPSAAWWSSG